MSKIYVASRLENIEVVKRFNHRLMARGHRITYDWTNHGPVYMHGLEVVGKTLRAELHGVATADLLIALLPGGRGTHCEVGAALGLGIPVIFHSEDPSLFACEKTLCGFYTLGEQCTLPLDEFIETL